MQEMKYIVDVIIPTYKPDRRFYTLLERLKKQTYKINKIIIINTDEDCLDTSAIETMDGVEIHHDKGEKIFGNYGDDSPMVYSKNGLIKAELTVYMQNGEEEVIDCYVPEDTSSYSEADSTGDQA